MVQWQGPKKATFGGFLMLRAHCEGSMVDDLQPQEMSDDDGSMVDMDDLQPHRAVGRLW